MQRISFDPAYLRLYVITDVTLLGSRDVCAAVTEAVAGGATLIQYREKSLSRREMYATAVRLRARTRDLCVPFVVNDYVDLAVAVDADAVHLGQTDLPLEAARRAGGDRLWYGVSTHNVTQAAEVAARRPDYLAIGPVFETATKTNPDPVVGIEGVRAARAAVGEAPLVAIGGLTAATAASVRMAGADGICAISAVWTAPDIEAACRNLAEAANIVTDQ